MNFILTLLLLVLSFAFSFFLCAYIIPFVGIIGSLIALSGKAKPKLSIKFHIGSIICAIFQTYTYMCYIAFMVSHIQSSSTNIIGLSILWVLSFLFSIIPIWWMVGMGGTMEREKAQLSPDTYYPNPVLHGTQYTATLIIIGFIIISLSNSFLKLLWGWIPTFTSAPIH